MADGSITGSIYLDRELEIKERTIDYCRMVRCFPYLSSEEQDDVYYVINELVRELVWAYEMLSRFERDSKAYHELLDETPRIF